VKRLAIVAMFLVAACGSVATAQAHSISLAYKAGESYKYALHFVLNYTIGIQGMTVPLALDMSAKEAVKVNSVDSAGVADIAITLTDVSAKTVVNGTTNTTTQASSKVEVKVGSDGHVISVNGNAMGNSGMLPGFSGTDSGFVSAILPDKPVKPGDTWSKSYDQSSLMGSTGTFHVTTDNKYVRDEKLNSVDAAVVESKINAAIDLKFDTASLGSGGGSSLFPSGGGSAGLASMAMQGTVKSDVTSWIDSTARRILKSHSTGSVEATINLNMTAGASQPGLTGPITFKGTQTLDMNPA
jgi:hypothetical protein